MSRARVRLTCGRARGCEEGEGERDICLPGQLHGDINSTILLPHQVATSTERDPDT